MFAAIVNMENPTHARRVKLALIRYGFPNYDCVLQSEKYAFGIKFYDGEQISSVDIRKLQFTKNPDSEQFEIAEMRHGSLCFVGKIVFDYSINTTA